MIQGTSHFLEEFVWEQFLNFNLIEKKIMKNRVMKLGWLASFSITIHLGAFAYIGPRPDKSSDKSDYGIDKAVAQNCLQPSSSAFLEINNVRTLIHSGGDMWWDLRQFPRYEVPKNSGKHSSFLGTLWIGGTDVNGQLKVAAQRYRSNGSDFYTGPLSRDGQATIDAATCSEFDRIWTITRDEVALHRLCILDPANCPVDNYIIPQSIREWPAISYFDNTFSTVVGSIQYVHAPFIDVDGDLAYIPENGDYPAYDLDGIVDCRTNRTPYLYGDFTLWWVFNDKGGPHNESQSTPIGMEIRAQAFAFTTNDEINSMTFYNYELINRGTTTLFNCYFGVNTDADIGFAFDDYTGCDVQRGFGYMYNGTAIDGTGAADHYGAFPPAIGIDFFEGPYMDPDGIDNELIIGEPDTYIAINGLGFGDGIIDNERFGMRRFVYYNNDANPITGDPTNGVQYYNFLRGFWRNGTRMVFGGNGVPAPTGTGIPGLFTDFMFPGDSDPLHWGTRGVDPGYQWTEEQPTGPGSARNAVGDRRFVQSSGPFTLLPGAVNDITTGVVWARSFSGGPFQSVELVRKFDDKAQALFENCFRVLDGPDAPDMTIREMDRELVIYLTNNQSSNNFNNKYSDSDVTIPRFVVNTTVTYENTGQIGPNGQPIFNEVITIDTVFNDRMYRFEGYLIYQLANPNVGPDERNDPNKARLVAQADLRNFIDDDPNRPIARLINYTFDEALQADIPVLEVDGANLGIQHSFRILNDQFATGDNRLVNHRSYYYMVIAYAYNNFKEFDPQDPTKLDGQKKPFLAGRRNIRVYTGIPRINSPENNGTILNTFFGDGPEITRVEGQGNGGLFLNLTKETEEAILRPPYRVENPVYQKGSGPVRIKVVDPIAIKGGDYILKLVNVSTTNFENLGHLVVRDTARWVLLTQAGDTVASGIRGITQPYEQLVFDRLKNNEFLGISIDISQVGQPGFARADNNGFIDADMNFADNRRAWLTWIPDQDGPSVLNWVRSGTVQENDAPEFNDFVGIDDAQVYERISLFGGGGLAPWRLVSTQPDNPGWADFPPALTEARMDHVYSIDLVLTPDKSKWSRVPVLETQSVRELTQVHPDLNSTTPRKLDLRRSPSVDKNGRYATVDGTFNSALLPESSSDPEAANFISNYGMGWFPGYAINVETGERLNIAFGEDSYLTSANGRDMLFNPIEIRPDGTGLFTQFGDVLLAGKHFVYIFGATPRRGSLFEPFPHYDEGAYAVELLRRNNGNPGNANDKANVLRNVMWCGIPAKLPDIPWLDNEVRIRLRVGKPYAKNLSSSPWTVENPINDNNPTYSFSLNGLKALTNERSAAKSALDLITVVPNPYYAFSDYERNQIDNRIKIVNLPPACTVSIYTTNGTLVRRFTKDDNELTSIDWDLKNYADVNIASGIYLIHVKAEGLGERVLKWFGVMRPIDLAGF